MKQFNQKYGRIVVTGGLFFVASVLLVGCSTLHKDKENKRAEGFQRRPIQDQDFEFYEENTRILVRENQTTRPSGSVQPAVLIINKDHITAQDVIRRARPQLRTTALTYSEESYMNRAPDILLQAARDIVSEYLIYQELSARIPEEQNPAIEKAVDKEIGNITFYETGGSKVLLEKVLLEQGMTMEDLRKQLKKSIIIQQYLRDKFKSRVIISRNEIWEYYQANLDRFSEPERIHFLLVEIDAEQYLPTGTSWANAGADLKNAALERMEKRAAAATKELSEGKEFSEVARTYSTAPSGRIGGDIGWIARGSYRDRTLEEKAFEIEPGTISDPINIENKIFILRIVDRKPGVKIGFVEAQSEIRDRLEQKLYEKLVMDHLAQLRDKAQIGSLEVFLNAVLQRQPSYEELRKSAVDMMDEAE